MSGLGGKGNPDGYKVRVMVNDSPNPNVCTPETNVYGSQDSGRYVCVPFN